MGSKSTLEFEKAKGYMDFMEVTDYLQKTLDFLKSNNSELYFPSISPYADAFLVNLVSDTRNLQSDSFNYEERKLAEKIIGTLELSREVFRWTHTYEKGNLLVYKKIFSNKMKRKPVKLSAIADRLIQARASNSSPDLRRTHHIAQPIAPLRPPNLPSNASNPNTSLSTSSKLRFINTTLCFIKGELETKLTYEEMPINEAEYLYNLVKNRDKDVGFGYKSLYAPLWEAMEECGLDFKFEVTLTEARNNKFAFLTIEKIPRSKKIQKDETAKNNKVNKKTDKKACETTEISDEEGKWEQVSKKSPRKKMDKTPQLSQKPAPRSGLPPLELLSNISLKFFKRTVSELTDFADDETRASVVFETLTPDEITFVKRVRQLAESPKAREQFPPEHRDALWRMNYMIQETAAVYKITATVNDKDRSITLKKTPKFDTPKPPAQSVTTATRSKSVVTKTRDRSISKDRLIQFEKGGKLPATLNAESTTDQTPIDQKRERGQSKEGLDRRRAKLLEDLSTPVESDRGMRMMLLMGWDGGALGARGDGIMEPVMPKIELPTRGGLGHVPPPKVTVRQYTDFRMGVLRVILDLLMHNDQIKDIQYKQPLTRKEPKFVRNFIKSLNKGTKLSLTDKENVLVDNIRKKLTNCAFGIGADVSDDLRTVTFFKVYDHPPTVTKPKVPKQKPVQLVASVPKVVPEQNVDVFITGSEVKEVMEDLFDEAAGPVTEKMLKKKATRLLFMMKLAQYLRLEWEGQIVFQYLQSGMGGYGKKLKMFLKSIIEQLNKDAMHYSLLGCEVQVFQDLLRFTRGSMLGLEFRPQAIFVLTRVPLIDESNLKNSVAPKLTINNNDSKTDNQNQTVNTKESTKQVDACVSSIDTNNVKSNNMAHVIEQPEKTPVVNKCVKTNNESNNFVLKDNESQDRNDIKKERVDNCQNSETVKNCQEEKSLVAAKTVEYQDLQHDIKKERVDNCQNSETVKNCREEIRLVAEKTVEYQDLQIKQETVIENHTMERVEVKTEPGCDISVQNNNNENEIIIKSEENTKEDNDVKPNNIADLSELDRDIRALEMTIFKTQLDIIKKEVDSDIIDLETAISETNLSSKRSRSSSVCSEELDPKKTRIDTDENIVIIIPKETQEHMTEGIIKKVQIVMANELDKVGGFLPLLKCHGLQNGLLIYSCHDDDDVAWLKKVISDAELDLDVVPKRNICLRKKDRELLIRINSYIPLDTKKVFRKFEIYNQGLDTKYWKVLHKYTTNEFITFIVTVDEKSFKRISDEKFSLYCGLDKAQFSVIYPN